MSNLTTNDLTNSEVKIKFTDPCAILPRKATPSSSGYDIFSNELLTLTKHQFALVSTGISMQLPEKTEAQIRPRSGLAIKHGITVINSPGTIDCDYRGEIKIGLINHSDKDFTIKKGMRIAQMVFAKVMQVRLKKVDKLQETTRGEGGFGSTGFH